MSCPACGARNAASAEWCSLCFTPLRTEPPAGRAPVEAPVEEPVVRDTAPATTPAEPSVTSRDGRFRRTGDGLDWRCAACRTWNPLERGTCATCGASFGQAFAPDDRGAPPPAVSETVVVGASLVLPGAGHVLLGRTGAGVLRMVLYVSWFLGGVLLLRAAAGSGQSILPAVPPLAGALVVLVASVVEAQRSATGDERVLLRPRITLWLVVTVLAALMLSFLAATLAVSR